MKNKLLQKLLIVLWVLLLSAMGVYYLFFAPRGSDFTEAENRTLAAFPEVTVESVFSGRFGEEFETYLLDRFPLREKAFSLVNRFRSAVSLASHDEYLRIAEDVKDPLDNTDYEGSMEALLQGMDATEAPTEPEEPGPVILPADPDSAIYQICDSIVQSTEARHAIVYHAGTGQVLYSKTVGNGKVFPASTTKVFNAWVALQYLDPNQIITAGEEITFIEDMASVAELRQGDACSVADMVKCMLLPSGCDAAYVLAVSAGRVIAGNENLDARSAVDVFVAEMNRQAKLNGMVNTHFVTPDGYHRSDHFISLDAFVKIGKLCLANEAIMAATQTYSCDIHFQNGRTMTMVNLNEVINPNSIYYRSACIGLKTGRTDAAGSCMLAAYRDEDDDRILLIGVFGCPAKDDRYGTANTLFDYFS